MQKLTHNTRLWIGNNSGSTLVLAVVFAILMAIGGIGFLLVTTNSINNDSDANTNDKAFQAAESGALLATQWIMARYVINWSQFSSTTLISNTINGLYDTVYVTETGKQALVCSEVYTKNPKTAATFKTRVKITIQNDR